MEREETAYGKFRKIKIKPIKRLGQYRGRGMIQATEEGLLIRGRHVYSLGARWAMALGIFIGSLLISLAVTGGVAFCAPGFIPLYLLVEYGILKREELLVPYSNIYTYVAKPQQKLIGIDFQGSSYCTPVAMHTEQWKAIFDLLQEKAPNAHSSSVEVEPWSKAKTAWILSLVSLGWYLLFFFLCAAITGGILSSLEIGGIPDIENIPIRILVFILLFLVPAIPAFFLTRRYYRKKRHPSAS